MADAATNESPEPGAVEGRPGVTVLTNENFNEYVDSKLGPLAPPETVNPDPEAEAAAEAAEIEARQAAEKAAAAAPKEGDVDGAKGRRSTISPIACTSKRRRPRPLRLKK
jgi:hypothetical protein